MWLGTGMDRFRARNGVQALVEAWSHQQGEGGGGEGGQHGASSTSWGEEPRTALLSLQAARVGRPE